MLQKRPTSELTRKVKNKYNHTALDYDQRYDALRTRYYDKLENIFINKFMTTENNMVLDIGTGTGRVPSIIKQKTQNIIGIDISQKMIEVAANKKWDNGTFFLVMDALNQGFKENVFDAIMY